MAKNKTNQEGLTWREWYAASTFNLSNAEKKKIITAEIRENLKADWREGVDPTEWASFWRQEKKAKPAKPTIDLAEERGIKAIIALQKAGGITETKEAARRGWRAMSASDKKQTLWAYEAFFES